MARLGQHQLSADVTTPPNGTGALDAKPPERSCALCGQPAGAVGATPKRFGEAFCSKAHAEEFVQAVQAARIQAATASTQAAAEGPPVPAEAAAPAADVPRHDQTAGAASTPQSWKGLLKMGLCCGAPLLALVVLAGGGGAVLGAAGALLPVLALLACPLGMYFMMRSMAKTGDHGTDKGGDG
jgi:hypothetical protein